RLALQRLESDTCSFPQSCCVFGAKSSLGFPAIVTRPGFVGCLNWRWLPFDFTWNQPSRSIIRTASATFVGTRRGYHCDPRHLELLHPVESLARLSAYASRLRPVDITPTDSLARTAPCSFSSRMLGRSSDT